MKSLKDISLDITEEQYREDGCMHYSTLATYERGGFDSLATLFDKKESTSLTFGGIVDCLITESPEEFERRYLVADLNVDASDTLINVTKGLFNIYKESYTDIKDIPDNIIIATLDEINYGKTWRTQTRIDKLRKAGAEYYKLMFLAQDKVIISSEMYNEALACVRALHESSATKFLFATNNPFEPNIERLYQLKFKSTFDNIDFSMMADLIVVLHDKKKIVPLDLKTSSHKEWDFYKSFIDWSYSIQARSYWRNLRQNLDKDDYFKDFELLNWHFVVVNKNTLQPLVWEYEDTKAVGTLYYGKNSQIICRDPLEIAKELKCYLDNKPSVPNGIKLDKPNGLKEWLNNI
jgi:hypothetical protein